MKIQMTGDSACRHSTITLQPYHARGTSIEIVIDDGAGEAMNITLTREDMRVLCDTVKTGLCDGT